MFFSWFCPKPLRLHKGPVCSRVPGRHAHPGTARRPEGDGKTLASKRRQIGGADNPPVDRRSVSPDDWYADCGVVLESNASHHVGGYLPRVRRIRPVRTREKMHHLYLGDAQGTKRKKCCDGEPGLHLPSCLAAGGRMHTPRAVAPHSYFLLTGLSLLPGLFAAPTRKATHLVA